MLNSETAVFVISILNTIHFNIVLGYLDKFQNL
jgi:hypothetical protein